ncbi:carboxymuconolactone decarboxylase [Acrocarpospora corrugata]|uniref:Carboxymuconolactone decarboxylase n=1 Tax=Acrocarpospora corrugata TaxID=35763 RepID=A0A5M3VZX5_9ACTN|nr:peroxidase-related enzyme [Acrocarpospora corrugata]GES00391.1 carboxymuconolactone decarboxylase [Acrocarpospora corrugata]
MPHITLTSGEPGIRGLFRFRPETARPLNELVESLLRADNTLSRGERELIAAYVSALNECRYCFSSHAAYAAAQLEGGMALVEQVRADVGAAPISVKMKALLAIAASVQQGGLNVTEKLVAAARETGATDVEIHDTVLIAAAFCMFNRYVDGLATIAPDDPDSYAVRAERIVSIGYLGLLEEAQNKSS